MLTWPGAHARRDGRRDDRDWRTARCAARARESGRIGSSRAHKCCGGWGHVAAAIVHLCQVAARGARLVLRRGDALADGAGMARASARPRGGGGRRARGGDGTRVCGWDALRGGKVPCYRTCQPMLTVHGPRQNRNEAGGAGVGAGSEGGRVERVQVGGRRSEARQRGVWHLGGGA